MQVPWWLSHRCVIILCSNSSPCLTTTSLQPHFAAPFPHPNAPFSLQGTTCLSSSCLLIVHFTKTSAFCINQFPYILNNTTIHNWMLCIYREALLITSLNSFQFFIPLSLVLVQDWSPDDWSHWTKFLLSPENDLESMTVVIIQVKNQNMKKNTCHQKGWGQSLITFHKARIENALLCNNTCLWIMVGSLYPGFSYLISNYN